MHGTNSFMVILNEMSLNDKCSHIRDTYATLVFIPENVKRILTLGESVGISLCIHMV